MIATRDIPLGTPASEIIDGRWVIKERVPADTVAAGAVASVAQLANLVALQPTYRGEQITARRFGSVQQQGLPSELGGTARIIELSGSATQLLAGTLERGNRVDVVGSIKLPESGQTHVAAVVLHNLLVVKAPPAETSSGLSSQQDTLSAELELTPLQAQRLFWLVKNGDWSLLLRPSAGARDPVAAAGRLHRIWWEAQVAAETRIRVAVAGRGAAATALKGDIARLEGFELVAKQVAHAAPDVVLLVHDERADPREQLATLREHSAGPVILATTAPSSELVHWALDAGIADVLTLPASSEGLHFAIEKAARAAYRLARLERGRVVTVFSPKGGSGKSVVSTNLAVASARHTSSRTLLIDLDLQFGDAAIMLGLTPRNTLHELIGTSATLDAEKLEVYTERHASGVDVLSAPVRPEDAELIGEEAVRTLLAVAREAYDLVVIDTAPFFYGPMLATLDETDQLLLLCNPDVPTLKNVRLTLQTLELLSFPDDRLRVVLNRASLSTGIARADVEAALGRQVDIMLPLDPAVPVAVNHAEAVVLEATPTPFGVAIIDLARSIGGGVTAPVSRASRGPKRFSFGRS